MSITQPAEPREPLATSLLIDWAIARRDQIDRTVAGLNDCRTLRALLVESLKFLHSQNAEIDGLREQLREASAGRVTA